MIRLLFYILLIYLVVRFVKGFLFPAPNDEGHGPISGGTDADLYKDPQCGTYFLKGRGVKAVINGEVTYFCSTQCRDEYLRQRGIKPRRDRASPYSSDK